MVLLEKAGQILNEINLTQSLEQTYQVEVDTPDTDAKAPSDIHTDDALPQVDTTLQNHLNNK